jgi:hypothetical protein
VTKALREAAKTSKQLTLTVVPVVTAANELTPTMSLVARGFTS